jgi:hypothetical protein
MKLNTQLVRHKKWPKFGAVSKKDSWNPADVWLLHKDRAEKWIKKIKLAQNVAGLNNILEKAFNDNAIVGISLKKSSAGSSPRTHERKTKADLFYSKVNFKVGGEFKALNRIRFGGWKFDLKWIESTNKKKPPMFEKITNELKIYEVDSNNKKIPGHTAEMRIGSNTSGPGNINLEYKPTGGAAQLGKIPKDLLKSLIKRKKVSSQGDAGKIKIPTLQDAEDSIPDDPKDKTDKKYRAFKLKIDMILKGESPITVPAGMLKNGGNYVFIDHICAAKESNGWDSNKDNIRKNVTMGIQILNWAWVLSTIKVDKGDRVFANFIKSTYYYAQKKGKVTGSARFGPFGKLS